MKETHKQRQTRKQKEYYMALVRTIWASVQGILALIALIFTLLIYHKVYFNGGITWN